MPGPYYVDPAAAGLNDGSGWLNAWTSIQSALDTAVAGEITYCRGTQTFAAATQLDQDTNSGTNAAGWIKFIGCNAAGNIDGTRFIINANNQGCHGICNANMDMVWFENFDIKNTGAGNFDCYIMKTGSTYYGNVFINCSFHGAGRHGIYAEAYAGYCLLWRCTSYGNGSNGLNGLRTDSWIFFSRFYDNTGSGIIGYSQHIGCLVYDNGDDGIGLAAVGSLIYNCAIDANPDDGIVQTAHFSLAGNLVIGSRITNHSGAGDIGLNCNSEPFITAYNYFEDNDGDNIQNTAVHQSIAIENGSTTSNIEDQANTNEGYTDLTEDAEDFNLRSDASLRRIVITIPKT